MEVKYVSPRFGVMMPGVLKTAASKLIYIISIITGWQLPDPSTMMILKDQFEKKLVEAYENLNMDEFEFALRNYPVKDWGKDLNLNLIDEVICQYLEKRNELSKIEESLKSAPPVQKVYTDEEILNERRSEIEKAYQAMRQGYYPIIHGYFTDVLLNDGLLRENSEPEWEGETEVETIGEFFVRKLNNQAANIYVKQ